MHVTPPTRDMLDPIEYASRDEISALQLDRLQWSLHHAYDNVEEYRRSFDDAGVHPDDLKTLSDLANFPFTTKEDLRRNYPLACLPCHEKKLSVYTLPVAPPENRQSLAIPRTTSITGRI